MLLASPGCGPAVSREQIQKEVLAADPAFLQTLQRRDELAAKIDLMERELALKEGQIDQQIAALRKEREQTHASVTEKIDKTRSVIKPFWERLDLDLSLAAEEQKSKRGQRAAVGHRISALRKALKGKQPAWTDEERARMDHDLTELAQETTRLDAEIAAIGQHLRLLKLKRLLLRL
ncbi:MAG: hypothetical protein HYZ92_01525 [Candidatus Omnitrophica bacterium]|nr:hypothetical protein [Candidatus Omnitrophota bacterium]